MGQTLSEPSREKHSDADGDDILFYGSSSMQGWRISMEDAHTTILKLDDDPEIGFFAVFDGHGGSSCAKFAGRELHKRLANDPAYKAKDYRTALRNTFLGTDIDVKSDQEFNAYPSGCTAVATLITSDRIFCSNAGDSRAVLSTGGKVEALSDDHKPTNDEESKRIVNAGGFVEFGRVNGNLALSRALGDFEFKKNLNLPPEDQIVTANPDISEHVITREDEFVVVACDGIWDCMTSQGVVDYVRNEIGKRTPLEIICEKIMDECLAPDTHSNSYGCDNMTIVIVGLLQGRTKEQWYDWMASRANVTQTNGESFSSGTSTIGNDSNVTATETSDADQEHADMPAPTTTSPPAAVEEER